MRDEDSAAQVEQAQPPRTLLNALHKILPHSNLKLTSVSDSPAIHLWLIDEEGMHRPLSELETSDVWETPPFWSFCWGSGLGQVAWIFRHREQIRGRTIIDFGCGSGVVGIAAALAGAEKVYACDLDQIALLATKHNSQVNGVELELIADFFDIPIKADWLFAADVLYDPENLPLLEHFDKKADKVIVADSRIKNFSHPKYRWFERQQFVTCPDLGEVEDVKMVNFYLSSETKSGL